MPTHITYGRDNDYMSLTGLFSASVIRECSLARVKLEGRLARYCR